MVRVLLDACVWGPVRDILRAAGHDVSWVGDWPADPGDHAILERAHVEGRVLVTLDKDFGELAIVRRVPHAGIVRLVDVPARQQAKVCLLVLANYGSQLLDSAIATVETKRVRIRLRKSNGCWRDQSR